MIAASAPISAAFEGQVDRISGGFTTCARDHEFVSGDRLSRGFENINFLFFA